LRRIRAIDVVDRVRELCERYWLEALMNEHPQPLSGNEMPRFAGVPTFMRLPIRDDASGLDACFVGITIDIGSSNRGGQRFGPRQIRAESVLLRPYNLATGVGPFDHLDVGDVGDLAVNPYDLREALEDIRRGMASVLTHGVRPIALGGDHTLTLPVLRAVAETHGKVGLIHVDAHADTNDAMFGQRYTHGTTFRRAVEEGLIDPRRVVQIGLRGTGYSPEDWDWGRELGFRVIPAHECWNVSLRPVMADIRAALSSGPVYVTFDIDGLDPSVAPGTGTPEVGGLTSAQGLEIIRGLRGLDIVGADVVEVAPSYDPVGTTALVAGNIAYELLCVLPGAGG
jgi:guanidinobutyrase